MGNVAFTWKGQGRDSEALQLMEGCLELRLHVLGINHPDTNSSLCAKSALGQHYKRPRRYYQIPMENKHASHPLGINSPQNGVLLRTDIHDLWDSYDIS